MSTRRMNPVRDLFEPVYSRSHGRLVPVSRRRRRRGLGCAGYWFASTVGAQYGVQLGDFSSFPKVPELDSAFEQVFRAMGIRHNPDLASAVIELNDRGHPYRAMKLIKRHIAREMKALAA